MAKTVAIVQSNYIPWKGYFDLIARCDEFILFDDVQYTKRDWRNRNRIKTRHGVQWLSIPVNVSGRYDQPIKEVTIAEPGWAERHWKTIAANYARAPFFDAYREPIECLYRSATDESLSAVNRRFIVGLCGLLGIAAQVTSSMDYGVIEGKTARLVDLCRRSGASRYISGPSARSYIEPELFERAGIELEYMEYEGYQEYPQLYPPFEHAVSVVDVLFSVGPAAREHVIRRR